MKSQSAKQAARLARAPTAELYSTIAARPARSEHRGNHHRASYRAGALPARLRRGLDALGAARLPAHRLRLAATAGGAARPGGGSQRQHYGHPEIWRIPEHQCSFSRAALRRRLHARKPDRAATRPPSAAADRCRHRGAPHACASPRAAALDPPGAVASRRCRERSVRGPGAAVRRRGGGIAARPCDTGAPRRATGAPAPLGGRRDRDRTALGSPGQGSACTRMWRCRRGGGISWRGSAATFCARPWPWSDSRRARVGGSCISFAGPGATAPWRCSSIPWNCWGAWRPSCRRRADLCWPTMGSSARGRAGDRPSCRSHRRPTHGETSTRAPRGVGPGLGYSSGCSALRCWCAIAAGAGGGSSAR